MAISNLEPVRLAPGDEAKQPRQGIALCLSGGGYRAMVFHLGALWRLNEAGLLRKLNRISSVSGGSITAGMLGLQWKKLNFDGTYWGIRTNIADYELPDAMNCPFSRTLELASTPTRLKAMGQNLKQRLVNWGYAVCDAALRKHVDVKIAAPKGFPYPAAEV